MTVAYDSGPVLPALAADLARQSRPPHRWLVVDNSPCSAPLKEGPLRATGVAVWPLVGGEGEGFGAGCNRAFAQLAAEGWQGWVWLLNPDTALPRGDELAALLAALDGLPPTALVGTAVVDGAGGLEASGGWIDAGLAFRSRQLGAEHRCRHQALAVDWLSGCNLVLRPTAHRPPLRFDLRFPLYYEDLDLCLRQRRRGRPVLWLPAPAVVHRRGTGSSAPAPRRVRLSSLGYLRFLRRHCPAWVFALRAGRLLLLSLLRLPLRPRRSLAALAALATVLAEPLRGLPA
ncbi:MAG: glycosyltransferase family 2 protein [Synechococcaceae cyanobacterium]|nr:glycosyltransferase family 2 protein [Synechococcaceae cyanobacterium]